MREEPYAQWSLGDYYPYLKDGNLSLGAEQVSPDAVEGRWELYQMIDPGDTVGLGHEHMSLTPGDPSVSIILHTIDPPDTGAPSSSGNRLPSSDAPFKKSEYKITIQKHNEKGAYKPVRGMPLNTALITIPAFTSNQFVLIV